ncbi:MAG: hypothetical protein OXK82_12635 [Deltaproteobacteria bacterium]|nr:hypothetical protein [Deltaproteobacteria bacterium]
MEAELYLFHQRFHRAAHTLDQVIAVNPELAEAYTLRGFARTMLRDYDGAMQDFAAALEMDAENADRAYAFRSYAHSEMGNYEDALADAEQARKLAHDDEFAQADAALAVFTAQYRSGDHGAINYRNISGVQRQLPHGGARRIDEGLAPYGLTKIYEHTDVGGNVQNIVEADTNLLLNPDDTNSYHRRHYAYAELRWNDKALEDLNKMIELSGPDRRANLHTQRARIWAQTGDHGAIVQNAGDLNPKRDIRDGAILAVAYWNLGDIQKATEAINEFDYRDPKVIFDWNEEYPPTNAGSLYSRYSAAINAHLAVKGALLAAQGQLEDGLRYLNLPACSDRIAAADADDVPVTWHQYGDGVPLYTIASQLANPALDATRHGRQWTERSQAGAMWEWCDYPAEFVNNPEAGVWVNMALPSGISQPNPPFPTHVLYGSGVGNANVFDPILMASNEHPDLHHYVAAWAQLGMPGATGIDGMREIDLAIELGADHPDAYRIKAETHLAWVLGWKPILRPDDDEAIQAWREHHYGQAVDAYATYESLATPRRWEAARYHFARGKILGWMQQKQEAQAAYQQAFQNGFDEEAVKKALNELNQ